MGGQGDRESGKMLRKERGTRAEGHRSFIYLSQVIGQVQILGKIAFTPQKSQRDPRNDTKSMSHKGNSASTLERWHSCQLPPGLWAFDFSLIFISSLFLALIPFVV